MQIFKLSEKSNQIILALGAESAGNFSLFKNKKIYFSEDFGNLLDENNFNRYKQILNKFINQEKITPTIILTDLHPNYKTTELGLILAKKFNARHIQVQHHIAHVFSQFTDNSYQDPKSEIQKYFYGIALDGTGYGIDGKIWGGEIFKFQKTNQNNKEVIRIGQLENQIMIGGESAIKEPARMIISILSKFLDKNSVYCYVKKFYTQNEFELLHNQFKQNFNCIETSSTGRILDAVAVFLGFAKNERNFKHEATYLLEKNSTKPYINLKPKIRKINNDTKYILDTTHLFKYLVKNINKDKTRLAATAQRYIIQGLKRIIINQNKNLAIKSQSIILSGGLSENKIISQYFKNKKNNISPIKIPTIPRGDAGISYGQIIHYLLKKSRD